MPFTSTVSQTQIRDCRQIANFCHTQQILSVKQNLLHTLTHPYLFYIVFQVLKVFLIKICKITTATRSFISFCFYQLLHQQASFFTNFQNFIKKYLKKKFFLSQIFLHKGFAHPTPLTSKICDKSFLLLLAYDLLKVLVQQLASHHDVVL